MNTVRRKKIKRKSYFLRLKDKTLVFSSVADSHHMDPDPSYHFDADLYAEPHPACYFEADPDPDPSFQIKVQNLD
jgi:hypothetical protein